MGLEACPWGVSHPSFFLWSSLSVHHGVNSYCFMPLPLIHCSVSQQAQLYVAFYSVCSHGNSLGTMQQ